MAPIIIVRSITPIAHGEDVLLQRAPPTSVLDPLYIPIPIPRYMHANLQASAATCMRICKRAPPHCMHDWHLTCNDHRRADISTST